MQIPLLPSCSRSLAHLVTVSIGILGCAGEAPSTGPNTTPSLIEIFGGDNQTANAGDPLGAPLQVIVSNSAGEPLQDISVSWSVLTGGGTLSATTSNSDSNGQASINYTLGPSAGENTVRAQLDEVNVVFTLTAAGVAAPAAMVNVGDNFFDPNAVTVSVGETVRWNWTGIASHNVTFDVGGQASATKSTGDYSRAFTSQGTFSYHCSIHGAAIMSGQVQVN